MVRIETSKNSWWYVIFSTSEKYLFFHRARERGRSEWWDLAEKFSQGFSSWQYLYVGKSNRDCSLVNWTSLVLQKCQVFITVFELRKSSPLEPVLHLLTLLICSFFSFHSSLQKFDDFWHFRILFSLKSHFTYLRTNLLANFLILPHIL